MPAVTKISSTVHDGLFEAGNLKWNPSFEAEILKPIDAVDSMKVLASYDEDLQRFVCTSLTVASRGRGKEVTGALLRDLKVAELVQAAALENIWVDSVLVGQPQFPVHINGEMHRSAAEALNSLPKVSGRFNDTDAVNATIAYAIAKVSGMPVLKTISKALGVSQSTSQRLIARAKELGYIDG